MAGKQLLKRPGKWGRRKMAEWDKKITEIREYDEAEGKSLDDESERLRKEKARWRNEEWRQEMKLKQEMELKILLTTPRTNEKKVIPSEISV